MNEVVFAVILKRFGVSVNGENQRVTTDPTTLESRSELQSSYNDVKLL